jgi:HSP20 family protein
MTLIPWKGKHRDEMGGQLLPATGFRTEMDRLFNSFFGDRFPEIDRGWGLSAWGPPLDVEETDKEIFVRAEIPGVNADDLELSMSGDSLVISGEKKESEEKKEKGYWYQERRFGSFRREVPLPSAVDADNVEAEYKDGVLHVTLHKAQEALPKRIPVKAK